jgi:hypothetical protein
LAPFLRLLLAPHQGIAFDLVYWGGVVEVDCGLVTAFVVVAAVSAPSSLLNFYGLKLLLVIVWR